MVRQKDFVPPIFSKVVLARQMFLAGNTLPKCCKAPCFDPIFNTFANGNTDLFIDLLLGCKTIGHYIDVGANDDNLPNSTRRFYNRGWSGINIEPQKKQFDNLCVSRKRDTNLNVAISDHTGKMRLLLPKSESDSGLATLEPCMMRQHEKSGIEVEATTLKDVFDKHAKWPIDFMSLDVEGHEIPVLKGNDWDKYRPTVIMAETIHDGEEKIAKFLHGKGYKTVYTSFMDDIFMAV